MTEAPVVVDSVPFRVHAVNTLVIGSGAAALNAAVNLHERGQADVLIVTEMWGGGASANAGSDKQTYYKLSLAGDQPDSPGQMAGDLSAGGSMHGDIALCEAQHSAQAFFRLVQLGVPFPHDAYGGFVGYRTDHDPRGRATSAGPLTSRLMVDALAHEVRAKQIPVLDRHQVVALLVDAREGEPRIAGAMALAPADPRDSAPRFVLFSAVNVVLATGGPGGLYADSVYPAEQTGSIGLAFLAGAIGQNLTESQYGLASIAFRWNVSGSYQQAIPRYVSTGAGGEDEHEFLNDAFPDMGTLATAVFRKGYQWPFDTRRVDRYGSSLIDLLVYRERIDRGRRVFLDYTRNADGGGRLAPFSFDTLDVDARLYLQNCGATGVTPIDRLCQMNAPAVELYRSHSIDLAQERLEIAVCAQHNNGGLKGNRWWESNVRGLFPIGEVNGSHGVYRPGGAALNAGQVGGLRAAMYIARRRRGATPDPVSFLDVCGAQIREVVGFARRAMETPDGERRTIEASRRDLQARMSRHGAIIRTPASVRQAIRDAWTLYQQIRTNPLARGLSDLPGLFRNLDLALAHAMYLEAIGEYLERGGESRGSYVVVNEAGEITCPGVGGSWRFSLNGPGAFVDQHVLEVSFDPTMNVRKTWTRTRPIPRPDTWFERVWKANRDDEVIR
jgi:succinate dehydrogenase/fumarate reductase flavoprotein subunit